MFSLAHITFAFLFGLLLGRIINMDRLLFACLLIAGDLPDIDGDFFGLIGLDGSALHGGPTHTIVGVIVLALILAPLLWLMESSWVQRTKSPAIRDEKNAWNLNRLGVFILIAVVGGLIHLGVDILNTSNEYARYHHLYLWPFSDYSFHLDLMLAGMPETREAAWQFRPIVKIIMALTNVSLISILWFLHLTRDKHFWDVLYSQERYYLMEEEPETVLRKVQKFLDGKKSILNWLGMIGISIAFIFRIYGQFVLAFTF